MPKTLIEVTRTAVRSLARTNIPAVVDASIAAGKEEAKWKDYQIRAMAAVLAELRELETLLSLGTTLSKSSTEGWTTKISDITGSLAKVKRGKASPDVVSNLGKDLKALVTQLKGQRLDALVEQFEQGLESVSRIEAQVQNALARADRSAARAAEERDRSKALADQSVTAVRRLTKMEVMAGQKRDTIALAQRDAAAKLDNLRSTEAEADSANRAVQALQKQLDALAAAVTSHVQTMRDTEVHVNELIAVNNQQKDDYLKELLGIRARADQALMRATAGSLYGVFAERQSTVAKKVRTRGLYLGLVSVIGAGIAAVVWSLSSYYHWDVGEQVVAKVGIASPILLLLWFLVYHYNRERLLEEEYAHKASMSASYPAFREEMLGLAGEVEPLRKAAVDLSLEITRDIFNDPLQTFKSVAEKSGRTKRQKDRGSSEAEITTHLAGLAKEIAALVGEVGKLIRGGEK